MVKNIIFIGGDGTDRLTLSGASTFTTVGVTLSGVEEFAVTSTTGSQTVNLSVSDADNFSLAAVSSVAGNLSLPANGNVTQAAALTVSGSLGVTTTNGAITLTNAGNTSNGSVSLANNGAFDVGVANNRALALGNVSVIAGNLTVSAAGNISQTLSTTVNLTVRAAGNVTQAASTTIAVAGSTTFSATVANASITLSQANAFVGSVGLRATGTGAVTLTNNRTLVLGNLSVGTGNVTISATNGNVTRAANVTLSWAGPASITAPNGTVTL